MPPPRWLIRDWLPASSLILIYGEPGAGKTFVALDIAVAIATGRDWNGNKVARGIVLYIAAEGVAGLAACRT
jgi:RecA-family ATPase